MAKVEVDIAPKDPDKQGFWIRFVSWIQSFWPERAGTPHARVRAGLEKALNAGEAKLDQYAVANEKMTAEIESALQLARLNAAKAVADEGSLSAELSAREAAAAQAWAQVSNTQADTLLKVAQGLKILHETGVTLQPQVFEDALRLVVTPDVNASNALRQGVESSKSARLRSSAGLVIRDASGALVPAIAPLRDAEADLKEEEQLEQEMRLAHEKLTSAELDKTEFSVRAARLLRMRQQREEQRKIFELILPGQAKGKGKQ